MIIKAEIHYTLKITNNLTRCWIKRRIIKLLLLTARQQQRFFPKIRCTKERSSNEGRDKPHGSKSWKVRCELSFERRGRIGSLAKPFDPIAKQTPAATRTSRDSGEIICSSQAVVYAKTHRRLHRRRNSYSRVTELPSLRLLSLSLSFPRRLCQFPTIPRRRSAKLCYFGLHEELCASYAPQWDYVADDLLLRESSVPSGPACPVTLMDLSPSHFRFNILINFPRILEVAIDVSCDLDGRKF